MWIAHYASGLVVKPFAPRVPLLVLTLAGALPDAAFFTLQFFGIETFNLDKSIIKRGGCFPYTNEYPYSHSLAGMTVLGIILALLYKRFAKAPPTPKDLIAIVATCASHFLLEWPSHREDIKITPDDSQELGADLFDSPIFTFIIEVLMFWTGVLVYTTLSPVESKAGLQNNPKLMNTVFLVMIVEQAHFCFGSAPTSETRWIHAPLFLFEILASCWLIGELDGQSTSAVGALPAPKKDK